MGEIVSKNLINLGLTAAILMQRKLSWMKVGKPRSPKTTSGKVQRHPANVSRHSSRAVCATKETDV
jgi:hypothetical protein